MNEIEKAVLEYLRRKPDGWFFFYGSQKLTRDVTIEKFKNDKAFREAVIKAIVATSLELLSGE